MTTTTAHAPQPELSTRPPDGPLARASRLHTDETGAQAMEYAALAGGGITIVTILIELLKSERVQDGIADFIVGLFDGLAGSLGNLF